MDVSSTARPYESCSSACVYWAASRQVGNSTNLGAPAVRKSGGERERRPQGMGSEGEGDLLAQSTAS